MMLNRTFCLLLASLCLLNLVNGHNWLVNPVSRGNQRDTQTGCRYGGEGNPTCAGPCDRKISQISIAPITVQRGQTLDIQWNRHNHPGGFIRFAWSPTSQSDSHASFDQYVDHFVCKDSGGCGPANPSDPAGTPNGLNCAASITVPTWVTNGAWTLQWAYFGGYYNAGDYYACVDYTVSGGPTGTQSSPYFIGGDATYPNQQKCLFYSTNALHVCTVEPCLNGTFPAGTQSGAPLLNGPSSPPVPTPPPTPVTTGRATTRAVTSGSATTRAATTRAVTTGSITSAQAPPQPVTTGRATTKSVTSGRAINIPATTAKFTTGVANVPTPPPPPTPTPPPVPVTTSRYTTGSVAIPTPPPSNNPCVLGEQRCTGDHTYETCSWATNTMTGWSTTQNCPPTLSCNPHPVYPGYIWCY